MIGGGVAEGTATVGDEGGLTPVGQGKLVSSCIGGGGGEGRSCVAVGGRRGGGTMCTLHSPKVF
jgi:hypothetical protein